MTPVEYVTTLARDGYLPAPLEHAFMVRGLFAAMIVGPLLGLVGSLVVPKRLAFFTQTIGHSALTGVALGALIGEPLGATYGGLYGFCGAVAVLMTYLKRRTKAAEDTVTGVVLALVLGTGVIALVLVTQQYDIHQVEAVLFGSLVTVNDRDLYILALTAMLVAPGIAWLFNRSLLQTLAPELAQVRKAHPVLSEYLTAVLVTIALVASLKLVGALLMLALIVVPAASARNLCQSAGPYVWTSIAFATSSALLGLLASASSAAPAGAAIVMATGVLFACSLLFSKRKAFQ